MVVEGCRSPEDKVLSGVQQGTVLGPLLFLCHINDLPSVVDPQTAVRLFADDCLVYRSITSNSDHRQLQLDLQALSHWGECWGMKFNVDKCHVLHTGRSCKCGIRFYEMNQVFLSEVQSAKYLGVLLSSYMSWSPHISSNIHKAHQRLWFIRRNLRGSPFKYREIAYQSLVRSQLEYCATIWDPTLKCDITKLEQIQRKAARWARGEYGIVSVTRLLKGLGWADLADCRRNQRIILLYKILHNLLAVPPDSINIQRAPRPARDSKNQLNLQRPRASDKSSPLWHCSIFRTIPDWNNLLAALAETESLSVFKSRLAAPKP